MYSWGISQGPEALLDKRSGSRSTPVRDNCAEGLFVLGLVSLLVRRKGDDDFLGIWKFGLFLGLGLEIFVQKGHLCGRGGMWG